MSRSIIQFHQRKAMQARYSGNKGANLARLYRYGIQIPEGFIISTEIYTNLLSTRTRQLKGENNTFDSDRIIKIFCDDITNKPLSRLAKTVKPELIKLGFPLAVRSSMTGEDGTVLSFAGQLDSFLNIKTEPELWEAIQKCYAGIFNDRVKIYLKKFDQPLFRKKQHIFSVAILIQKMVDARAAGVAFGANPFTGQTRILIEAVRGLGDKLMQGKTDPDCYFVHPETAEIEHYRRIKPQPVLTKDQILRLSQITRDISTKFKQAQDIEWAWDGKEFFVLQSRPVTAIGTRPVYSNNLVSDMIPGIIKPLIWSTNALDMTTNVFGRIFRQIYGQNQLDFRQLVRRVTSRVYINVHFLADIFTRIGLPVNFFDFIVKDEKPVSKKPQISFRFLKNIFRLGIFVFRQSRQRHAINKFIRIHDERLEEFRQQKWEALSQDQVIYKLKKLRKMHLKTQWYMWIGAMNMTIRNKVLKKFVQRRAPHVNPINLIRGLVGLKSLEPNYEMWKLAQRARNLPVRLQKQIFTGQLAHLDSEEKNNNVNIFLTEYQRFLNRFGYLSMNGTDFSIAPWIENSNLVLKSIERLGSISSPLDKKRVQKERDLTRMRVCENLHGFSKLFFNMLLKSTIRYIALRERLSLLMSEDAYQMRRIYLRLAELLVSQKVLEQRDDIFYLYYLELLSLFKTGRRILSPKSIINKRKNEIRADLEIEPADIICDYHVKVKETKRYSYLVGIIGSLGVARGIARIVRNPDAVEYDLSPNDILVVPFIDVGWTPLFPYVAGVVTETGGQLSHSAIIAREYGLPAVLCVKNATYAISEGQAIIVDGNVGRVYLENHL